MQKKKNGYFVIIINRMFVIRVDCIFTVKLLIVQVLLKWINLETFLDTQLLNRILFRRIDPRRTPRCFRPQTSDFFSINDFPYHVLKKYLF